MKNEKIEKVVKIKEGVTLRYANYSHNIADHTVLCDDNSLTIDIAGKNTAGLQVGNIENGHLVLKSGGKVVGMVVLNGKEKDVQALIDLSKNYINQNNPVYKSGNNDTEKWMRKMGGN